MSTPKPPSQPGCTWAEECMEICMDRAVYVEDEGVRATFRNPQCQKIRKIHYDGCYSKTEGPQADFIVGLPGRIDVIVELKGSDTNLKYAAQQIESTLHAWRQDGKAERKIAGLIVYGRIEGKKRLPGRAPRAVAVISGLTARFFKSHKILLIIRENGQSQFTFENFGM